MPINEIRYLEVACDEPGCRDACDNQSTNEEDAIEWSKRYGYTQRDGKWYCAEHSTPASKEQP